MNKVAIVGCGNVGMAYAYALLQHHLPIDHIVLIDVAQDKLIGKALDLSHSVPNLINSAMSTSPRISIGSYEDCRDATIVCITAGVPQNKRKHSRMEDLTEANQIFKTIIPSIAHSGFSGIYLIASNPLDVMTYVTWKYAKCDSSKVIGSGTILDTARLHCVLAEHLSTDIQNISGYVLGEHGNSQFVAWSTVNVSDFSSLEKQEIEMIVRDAGFTVAKSQGFTCYGIASGLLRITQAVLCNEQVVLPVCTYQEDLGIYISTPSLLGDNGILKTSMMHLLPEEQDKFYRSAIEIKTAIGSL